MKHLLFFLYTLTVVLLGASTFVEHAQGTDYVAEHIYHTWWFCALWALLAVMLAGVIVSKRLWRRTALLLFHASFVVILIGAFVTFTTSAKGYVHLQRGETIQSFADADDSSQSHALPFSLSLDSFVVVCYPGTQAPSDYVSYLHITDAGQPAAAAKVSMNSILTHRGYRFYQSSFDEDAAGSWLSVNYDPYGTFITYLGYLLLALSVMGVLFSRREEFMRLLRHPLLRKTAFAVLLGFAVWPQMSARHNMPAFTREKADSLARRQVMYNDRVAPFNTLARDFVLKITGRTTYRGLTPEQVVSGWLLRPDAWQHEPMILIKSAELRGLLHIEGKYARLTDLFSGDEYLLQRYWKGNDAPAQSRSSLQKAIEETDEKVGLILMLQNGELIRPLPADGSVKPLSESRLNAELLYNRVPFTKILFMFNLLFGILSFAFLVCREIHPERCAPRMGSVLRAAMWLSLAAILFAYVLRWYIAAHIPLSNGYETMLFLALAASALAAVLHRRFSIILPFGFLLSGFALLVSHLGQMNPQITPLVPVLVSPWLSTHVSFVMIAYALLAFILFNGIAAFCMPRHAEMLMLLSRLLLYPAVFMLGIGIFLGAVWANQSWGTYWSWDPKEVWALITFMIYGAAFHAESIPWLRRARNFHLFAILAFLTVLMTYLGVNYFLGGMHSYA